MLLLEPPAAPCACTLDDIMRTSSCDIALLADLRERITDPAAEPAQGERPEREAPAAVPREGTWVIQSTGDDVRDLLGAAALIHGARSRGYPAPTHLAFDPTTGRQDRYPVSSIMPVFDGMLARLKVLLAALQEGIGTEDIPDLLACGTCTACAPDVADIPEAELVEAPEIEPEDTAAAEATATWAVPQSYEDEDNERYRLQKDLDARLEALERQAQDSTDAEGPATSDLALAADSDEYTLAMVLAATNYHRGERAPFWLQHMRRLHEDPAGWATTRDCAVFDSVEVLTDWQQAVRGSGQVRLLHAVATPGEGSTFKAGDSGLYLMYPVDGAPLKAVEAMPSQVATFRHANPGTYLPDALERVGFFGGKILEMSQHEEDPGKVIFTLEERIRVRDTPHEAFPLALAPAATVPTVALEHSLQDFAQATDALFPDFAPNPGLDILRRTPPRLRTGGALPRETDYPEAKLPAVEAVSAAVQALDSSYVAVQGPPGTGKTFLGSHVIARLVASGAKVGVVAQSHAVVENMLGACIDRGVRPDRVVKLAGTSRTPDFPWSEWSKKTVIAECAGSEGFVFAGTAWNFSNASLFTPEALDLLVVDEAGQFSLANTLAVSRAGRNLLLLGDPQQLPQVSTGRHPYPVDVSALGWLSGHASTLDEKFGYFLGTTWRMHPRLCLPVSALSYNGRLISAPTTESRALEGVEPGLYVHRVSHVHDTVRSVAEAEQVVRIVRGLIGACWDDGTGNSRRLRGEDIVVVAAYNAQVDTVTEQLVAAGLATADGHGVRVGTVDRFQGQQAPVTIVSLAASIAGASGRGAGFLLSQHRLNVALSRGQWCSVLVRSPLLHRFIPASGKELVALGDFMVLCASAADYRSPCP